MYLIAHDYCIIRMCGSRKNPFPPHERTLEIPRGRGVLKAKFLEEMYENKLEFPGGKGGGGAKQKKILWGEYGYFLELHNRGLHFLKDAIKFYFPDLNDLSWSLLSGHSIKIPKQTLKCGPKGVY